MSLVHHGMGIIELTKYVSQADSVTFSDMRHSDRNLRGKHGNGCRDIFKSGSRLAIAKVVQSDAAADAGSAGALRKNSIGTPERSCIS